MIQSIFYTILAGLGLSFLVFIHELGHYVMARRAKMRIEVFSIGFGKPLLTWMHKGVKWQLCLLLFGGYVKIAGMEKEGDKEPYEVKDGFYGKRPIDRIKVAIMGPLVNIVFAFFLFTLIWVMGGRMKPFEEYTKTIGWVDPASELAHHGVKSGDTIDTYNGKPFTGFRDLLYSGILNEETIAISGERVDYMTGVEVPYSYNLRSYHLPEMMKGMRTIGVLSPASLLIFGGFDKTNGQYSPVYDSGIHAEDRVVWANGESIFSAMQLRHIVNQNAVFLTVERDGEIIHVRAPRVPIGELHLAQHHKDEFLDWKRALGVKTSNEDLYSIPYEVDPLGYISQKFTYIDSDLVEAHKAKEYRVGGLDAPLQKGDRILAANGEEVTSGLKLFDKIRERQVLLIVQKAEEKKPIISWKNEDEYFEKSVNWKSLNQIATGIGRRGFSKENREFKLLTPITPSTYREFLAKQKKGPEVQESLVMGGTDLSSKYEYIFLGSTLQDRLVIYNPTPTKVFKEIIHETWYTLSSLVQGSLSPKWLSGPIGIVKVMHDGWQVGVKEALYWIALISLSLGIFNLFPIPVLDGGHIAFSLWEMVTKKRISSKTMERLVLPFIILLIMFFVYITYQDISRIFLK